MGLTYAQSFLRAHITSKQNMMILEKSPEKAQELAQKDIGTVYGRAEDCIRKADLVIFAVKPQDSGAVFATLRPLVDGQQVFLSIMAGVKIETISRALAVAKVIRGMPNLPAQIGRGMTAFTSSEAVTRIELVTVQNLLNTTGKTVYVESEDAIDASTAVSGSGPAYVWYFMEGMIKAGRQLGFSEAEAELLVSQTFLGAVELYLASNLSCTEWIQRVSSKGGTTEAAMRSFRATEVEADIVTAARAAYERAVELGKA